MGRKYYDETWHIGSLRTEECWYCIWGQLSQGQGHYYLR